MLELSHDVVYHVVHLVGLRVSIDDSLVLLLADCLLPS